MISGVNNTQKTFAVDNTQKELEIDDYVKVRYTTGKQFKDGIIKGKITKLWTNPKQGQVENGWCFHDHDEILEHKPSKSI